MSAEVLQGDVEAQRVCFGALLPPPNTNEIDREHCKSPAREFDFHIIAAIFTLLVIKRAIDDRNRCTCTGSLHDLNQRTRVDAHSLGKSIPQKCTICDDSGHVEPHVSE